MTIEFPLPAVLCDVGGTNTRIAALRERGVEILAKAPTRDFADIESALEPVFQNHGLRPRSIIVCGAGPVEGRRLGLTNAPWRIDGEKLADRFGLAQGLLLNDFEAQALTLPVLGEAHTRTIGPRLSPGEGPRVILGPGTGLGVAALIEVGGKHAALPTEAGHIDFAPVGHDEERLWPILERVHGRITAEALISGPGLERLHAARTGNLAKPEDRHAAAITAAANRNPAGEEARTVKLFWRLTARFAGDMAIVFGATGGVTLAGGILPRLAEFLDEAEFRQLFCAKEPVEHLPQRTPTQLLVAPDAVLEGMAAIARTPQVYAIDYRNRAWR